MDGRCKFAQRHGHHHFCDPEFGQAENFHSIAEPQRHLRPEDHILLRQLAKSAQLDLSYVGFGYWTFPQVSGPGMERVFGVYGYETSSAAMPASGTASFSGPGKMNANVYDSNGRIVAAIGGDAFFSVDFASGNLMGTFTKNSGSDINCLPYPFPDVSVKAGIAAGSNQFRGTTAVASQPAIPAGGTPPAYNLGTSATGSINGAFYGPAAQNLGAVWTLSDGHTSVLGTVGAAR
jgi:hypothetical protein